MKRGDPAKNRIWLALDCPAEESRTYVVLLSRLVMNPLMGYHFFWVELVVVEDRGSAFF